MDVLVTEGFTPAFPSEFFLGHHTLVRASH